MEEKNRAGDSASGTGNWKPCPSLAGKRLIHTVLKTNGTDCIISIKRRAQGAGTTKPEIEEKNPTNHTTTKPHKHTPPHKQTNKAQESKTPPPSKLLGSCNERHVFRFLTFYKALQSLGGG